MPHVVKSLLGVLVLCTLGACGGGDSGGDGGGGGSGGGGGVTVPSALSYPSPQALVAGTAMSVSPTVTGTVSSYAVAPALPAGLALNTTTGVISGTPTAETASVAYTVTASNSAGSTSFALTIAVARQPTPPTGLSYPSPKVLYVSETMTPILPTVTGTVNSYAIAPALPFGLILNTSTGEISGSTNLLFPESTYTITATNADGSASFALKLSTTLSPPVLSFSFAYRRLTVSWDAVPGALIYRVFTDNTDDAPSQLGGDLTELSYSAPDSFFTMNWQKRRYFLRACNGAVCSESTKLNIKDWQTSSITYLKAADIGYYDNFGRSVGLGCLGYCMVVGIPGEDSEDRGLFPSPFTGADALAQESGAVLYRRITPGAGPTSLKEILFKASNAEAGDLYGSRVAISEDGRTIAISAPLEAGSASIINGVQSSNGAPGAGAVYVYREQTNGSFVQEAYLKPFNTGADDRFGNALAVSGDGQTVVVGAPGEDSAATTVNGNGADNSAASAGAAYVFTRSAAGVWSQRAYLKASNTGAADVFGSAVAVDYAGATIVVGAPGEQSNDRSSPGNNSLVNAGAAYTFVKDDDGQFSLSEYLKAFNPGLQDRFGTSVAISGDGKRVAVGAPQEDSSTELVGSIFEFAPDPVSDDAAENAGAVYVFLRGGPLNTGFFRMAYLKSAVRQPNTQFGDALAMTFNGGVLAVGASEEASAATGINGNATDTSATRSGAVFLFTHGLAVDPVYSQSHYIKARNSDGGDQFGISLSLESNGASLLVGAPSESSSFATDPSDNVTIGAGAAYLY